MRKSRSAPTGPEAVGDGVVEDLMGGFRDWLLQDPGAEFVFLRPDRYVAAVCGASELNEVSARLRGLIGGEPGR